MEKNVIVVNLSEKLHMLSTEPRLRKLQKLMRDCWVAEYDLKDRKAEEVRHLTRCRGRVKTRCSIWRNSFRLLLRLVRPRVRLI